jgi:hypothetical protein
VVGAIATDATVPLPGIRMYSVCEESQLVEDPLIPDRWAVTSQYRFFRAEMMHKAFEAERLAPANADQALAYAHAFLVYKEGSTRAVTDLSNSPTAFRRASVPPGSFRRRAKSGEDTASPLPSSWATAAGAEFGGFSPLYRRNHGMDVPNRVGRKHRAGGKLRSPFFRYFDKTLDDVYGACYSLGIERDLTIFYKCVRWPVVCLSIVPVSELDSAYLVFPVSIIKDSKTR